MIPRLLLFLLIFPTLAFLLVVIKPTFLEGAYRFSMAAFGEPYITSNCDPLELKIANPFLACHSPISNVNASIALVIRGNCAFVDKARNVELAGGQGMIVMNDNIQEELQIMSYDYKQFANVSIRSVMISNYDGQTFLNYLRKYATEDSGTYPPILLKLCFPMLDNDVYFS